jgi:hypothetical protein
MLTGIRQDQVRLMLRLLATDGGIHGQPADITALNDHAVVAWARIIRSSAAYSHPVGQAPSSRLWASYSSGGVHDLRAAAATNLPDAGAPPHVVRDVLGHEDIRVTNGCARSHDDALSLAVAALDVYSGRA